MIADSEIIAAVAQGEENAEGIRRRLGKDRIEFSTLLGRLHTLAEAGQIKRRTVDIGYSIKVQVFSV